MKSKFLNELLNENYKNQNEDFTNIIDLVVSSDKFRMFKEMMEDIREEYFVKDTIHGISHNERVAFLAMAIGIHEGLSETELKIVIKAALYHDIGRTIAKGRAHGIESAKIINEYKEELANGFNDEELNLLNFLCCIHSNPDEEMDAFAKQYNMDLNIAKKLMNVLKDADALDRVRLSRFGKLDESFLRLDYSKSLISISNDLLNFYRNIQSTKTYTIENFNSSVFETNSFNIIEDDENIYVFRALNQDNEADIDNPDLDIIKTKRQVSTIDGEIVNYEGDNNRSLEEVYSAVRVSRRGKINNCISFSSNSNVTLDYNSGRYIMYAIPKNGDNSIFSVGKYMLEEISKKISSTLETENVDDEVLEILHKIDEQETNKGIVNLVGESLDYLRVNKEHKRRFTGKDNNITTKESLISRFEKKQFLNENQQLEYSKIIAKLTILENSGILRNILPSQSTNSSLIAAIGSAFSSSELIHYGNIPKGKVTEISKEYIELFSIIQQMQEQSDIDQELVKLLKLKILNDIKNKREIHVDNNIIPENQDELSPEFAIDYFRKDQESTSIIPYYTGKIAMEYTKNYALAKLRTYKLLCILRDQFQDEQTKQNIDFFIQQIIDKVVVPDSSIIGRRNNRGIKLAESVNLDMNPNRDETIFSLDEQKKLIKALNELSYDELEKIVNGDYSIIREKRILIESIDTKDYRSGENDYFIDYIVDSIDFENIYKVSNITKDKKNHLKGKLKEKLSNVEISRLYNALINADISYEEVPYYIVNLLLEDGYKDYNTFEELVNSDNLEQIIKENVNNLNKNITAYSLDIFLGILDNSYIVPNTNIKLREYQEHAVNGIDKIFENRRFAGVVLPTGAGKSFVAMAEMMKFQKKNIVYFAPQEEILNQFQKHILKYVLQKSILTIEDVSKMELMTNEQLQEFLKDKVYNQDANIANELKKLKNSSLTEDEKDKIRRNLLPRKTEKHDDVQDTIKEVFPHLEMYCYQSLNSSEYENLLKKNADLIVFDELHRTGAATWQSRIKGLLDANDSAKILGITATPIRDDEGHVDMMKFMAKKYGGFTKEEIEDKAYLAEEMYLIDAMQNKYVVEPQIVSFTATLGSTEEYQFVVERLNEERKKNPSSDLVKELETIKEKMDEIIGSKRDVVENNLSSIGNVIQENIPVSLKNGRFIVFLPRKPDKYEGTAEEYVNSQIEQVNHMLTTVNPNIDSGYLLSNRQEKFKNAEAISNFETADNNFLKVLYAINMLNEGVHVENINGEIMLRKIGSGSNILYFQQIGRVIFSIDPKNPPSEDERPIIFDVYNNYLSRDLDRVANMTTQTSDLNNIQMIKNWIIRHERMPDINSPDQDEARKAITLKRIQEKYERYLNGINNGNLSNTEIREIIKILEIAKSIDLFDTDIPDRIIPPGEKELGRVNAFAVKGEIRNFLDLYKHSKKAIQRDRSSTSKKSSKVFGTLRAKYVMSILQVLSEYGLDISDKNFITIFKEISPDKEESLAKKKLTLLDIVNTCFSEKAKETVIRELDMDREELAEFLIYEEFDYARESFWSGQKLRNRIFSFYDIKDIRKCGLLKDADDKYIHIDKYGFIEEINCPETFKHINVYTGTNYDTDGYDYYGFDFLGYDREGNFKIDKYGFHKNGEYYIKNNNGEWIGTGLKWNERGFDCKGEYHKEYVNHHGTHYRINTNSRYDAEGFDIDGLNRYRFNRNHMYVDENGNESFLNPLGFAFDGNFYKYDESTQQYIKTGRYYDDEGYDIDGLDRYLFNKNHLKNGSRQNEYGFNYLGDYHGIRGKKYDIFFFDIDGYFYRLNPETNQREKTNQIFNDEYFDRDGYYYEYDDSSGQYYRTEFQTNPQGYNRYGNIEIEQIRDLQFRQQYLTQIANVYELKVNSFIQTLRELKEKIIEVNKQIPEEREEATILKPVMDTVAECIKIKDIIAKIKNCTKTYDVLKVKEEVLDKIKLVKDDIRNIEKLIKQLEKEAQRYRALQKKEEERQKREEEARQLIEAVFERRKKEMEKELETFRTKFDENGKCIETDLTYDQHYFNFDGINVITNKGVNPRGFDFSGKCRVNDFLPYDKGGFDIDGIHIETGERYYNGYNAYGVDKNGKNRKGEIPIELKYAREYIEIIFGSGGNPALIEFMKKYIKYNAKRTLDEAKALLKRDLYVAGEMYPPFKDEIIAQVTAIKGEITKLNQTIEDYKKQGAKQVRVIGFYEAKIKKLQEKLKLLSFDIGEK